VTAPSIATVLAAVVRRLRDLYAAAGVVLLAGAAVAALGIVAFAWVAAHVVAGRTQAFDEAVLGVLARHRVPWLQSLMLDVTLLGATSVVVGIAVVAALFLALTRHRDSAALLVASTVGAQLLNDVLKRAFDRPRPHVFDWGTQVATTSFPSGHAMSAAAVYATVAYLAARRAAPRAVRVLTYAAVTLVILAVAFSRLYLGVHYPTDVAAGLVVGWTWAAFCVATLEAGQRYRSRREGPRTDS
jgi:undecaprenyl-diphosphatase